MKAKNKFARIYFVRHGEAENKKHIIYGYLPVPLSPKGKTQSRKAGIFLKKQNIAAIFSSPQKRTQETAKIISQAVSKGKYRVQIDKNLRESEFGHLTQGMTRRRATEKFPKEMDVYKRNPAKMKAGETFAKMAERMFSAIQKGVKKFPGQNLVFVSHRDPIVAALLKMSNRSFNDLHKVKGICGTGSICEVWSVGKKLINKTYLVS